MPSHDAIRLRHMLDAANEALEYANGLSRGDLDKDRKTVRAITAALLVLGEAAARVGPGCRQANPDIPWADIVGMRNRLIHAYHDINLDVVWQTIREDLPPLIDVLGRALDDAS